jgi:hypothetical protein
VVCASHIGTVNCHEYHRLRAVCYKLTIFAKDTTRVSFNSHPRTNSLGLIGLRYYCNTVSLKILCGTGNVNTLA